MLQALEEYYQREGIKGEPIVSFDFSGLEIEHVLPQEWKRHWPLPPAEGAQLERDPARLRPGAVPRLGRQRPGLTLPSPGCGRPRRRTLAGFSLYRPMPRPLGSAAVG